MTPTIDVSGPNRFKQIDHYNSRLSSKHENIRSEPRVNAAKKHFASSSASSSEMGSNSDVEVPGESSSASNGSGLIEASKSLIISPAKKVMKA